jgi:hypothetical protein
MRRRTPEDFKKLDDWLLKLHRDHPWKALALAFWCALVLCGLAWILKTVVVGLVHLVTR